METKKYVLLTQGYLYPLLDYSTEKNTIKWIASGKINNESIENADNSVCVIDISNSNSITDIAMETLVKLTTEATKSDNLPSIEFNHIKYIIEVLDSNKLIVMKHLKRFNKFMGYDE